MASQPGMQPPPPRYNPPYRSLAPAVTLILLGGLFLLQKLHMLPANWWHGLWTWWPLLLILAGVIRLVEYGQARRSQRPVGGFGALGVVLFAVVIVLGLGFSLARHIHGNIDFSDWDHVNGDMFDGMFGNPYAFHQTLQQDFPAGASLRIVSEGGDISVKAWEQNQIKVSVNKRIRAHDQSGANQTDAATQAQLTVNGTEVVLNANTLGEGSRGVKSDLLIYLPRTAALAFATRHGDITVDGRTGDLEFDVAHGDIAVSNISGNVNASVRSGSLSANKLEGNIAITGHSDEIKLTDITGKASVDGEVSDGLFLTHIGKQASFRSSRTDLEIAALPGELRLTPDDLNARQVTGPFHLVTRSKDIHIENVTGDLHIENANGQVEIHPDKTPLGVLELSNSHADVRLVLPAKAEFTLDATAHSGEIHSDFGNLSITGQHGDSRASGHVGNGGARIEINNEHGDVEIRKN